MTVLRMNLGKERRKTEEAFGRDVNKQVKKRKQT